MMQLLSALILLLGLSLGSAHAATEAPAVPLFSGGSGSARTWWVVPSGGATSGACDQANPCTRSHVENNIGPNELAIFRNGTYGGRFEIDSSGTSGNHIIFRAENLHQARFDDNVSNIVRINGSFVTLDGFYISDNRTGVSGSGCVQINPSGGPDHIILENLHIDDCGNNGIKTTSSSTDTDDIIIRNNLITGVGWSSNGCGGNSCPGEGLYLGSNSGNGQVTNHIIYGNEITGHTTNCMDLKDNARDFWIFDNICRDDDDAASDRGFSNQPHDGQIRPTGTRIYIYRNKIFNYRGNAFDVAQGNMIYNNVVYDCVDRCNEPIEMRPGQGSGTPEVFNNTFHRINNDGIDDSDGPVNARNNIGINRTNNVRDSQVSSNWFVGATDFRLTENATGAIDLVTGDPFSATDFEGAAIHGSARDYGAYEFAPTTSFFGPPRASIGTDGTILSTTDAWQSTLEGASSGTFRLNAGTYNISGTLNLDGIKLATNNGADVTMVGTISIDGSDTIIEGIKLNADGETRCIQAIRNNESTGWTGIEILANEIFGGRGGDCVRIEGNIVGIMIKDNHIDGGAGPDSSSGHGLNILGGCTRSGDDDTTPFTYTCRPEGTIIRHNLFTKLITNHPTWSNWGSGGTEDALQMQGHGNAVVIRNAFEAIDPASEEFWDIKTPFAGTTTVFRENYINGQGMNHDKSCAIVQGDWDPGQFQLVDNLFDRCAQNFDQRTFRGGVNKPFGAHNISMTGNIFNCSGSPGADLVFNDLQSFSATGNTIDNCQISGATISATTNAFANWQGTHANGASNQLTIDMANGDFTRFHALEGTVFSTLSAYGDQARYIELTPSRWEIVDDAGDLRYGINTSAYSMLSGNRLGEYTRVGETWGDFTFTLQAQSTEDFGTNSDADFAVVFGWQDASNYAFLKMSAESGLTGLFVIEAGVRSTIVTSPAARITDNLFNEVHVSRTGNQVSVEYDGGIIFSVVDSRLGNSGDVGFGSENDIARFDDPVLIPITTGMEWHVRTTGSDSNTCTQIQSPSTPALTINYAYGCASADGDLIDDILRIGGGEYNESLTISHSGSAQAPFQILPVAGQTPIIDGTGVTSPSPKALLWLDGANYVQISGITVRDEANEDCIEFAGGVGVELDNLTVDNCASDGILFVAGPPSPAMAMILNSTVTNTVDAGIRCFNNPSGYLMIKGNTVSNAATSGGVQGAITVFDCPFSIIQGNTVRDIPGPADSIFVRSTSTPSLAHHVVVEGNFVERGTTGGHASALRLHQFATQTIVRRNQLHDLGIEVDFPLSTPDVTVNIYHNTVVDAGRALGGSGIHALQLINNNGAFQGLGLINNAFIESEGDLLEHGTTATSGLFAAIGLNGNAYKFSTGTGITWWDNSGLNTYTGDTSGFDSWKSTHGQEPSGGVLITADQTAIFVDPANADFTPVTGSPLINAGLVALTTTISAGSGNNIPVVNSSFFTNGFGLTTGDQIQVGQSQVVTVSDVIDATNTIVVQPAISWTAGANVSLSYVGVAPDIGAIESLLLVTIAGNRLGGRFLGGQMR